MADYVLEHGADVDLKHRDETLHYDRIEFTRSGMVVCFNKQAYTKHCYPREQIEGLHTHTSDREEDAHWW